MSHRIGRLEASLSAKDAALAEATAKLAMLEAARRDAALALEAEKMKSLHVTTEQDANSSRCAAPQAELEALKQSAQQQMCETCSGASQPSVAIVAEL